SLALPAREHRLERAGELSALELGVQRVHVAGRGRFAREPEDVRGDILRGEAVGADQLVERGQRGRQLRAGDDLGAPYRDEGTAAARIRAVVEAHALREPQRVQVHLPAGGSVRPRRPAEDTLESLLR